MAFLGEIQEKPIAFSPYSNIISVITINRISMKQTKTDRLHYERPSIRVVELQQQTQLLSSSPNGVNANRRGYGDEIEEEWG